jgi:zinc transporter, ZIP family
VRRLLVVLLVVAVVGAGAGGMWIVRGDGGATAAAPTTETPGLTVERSMLHPGMIMLVARNDGAEAVTIAQVLVNDAYVGFGADRLTVPPGGGATVSVQYTWIAGESYEVGLLTADGQIVAYELEDAGET